MGFMARLGRWQLDDGVSGDAVPLAEAQAMLGGAANVTQLRDVPAAVAIAFGMTDPTTPDRATAMKVPAIRRGRQVICGVIGAQPLVALRTNSDGSVQDVTADRQLIRQPDPNTTLQWQLTWTVDDLLFHGISWWRVTARDAEGKPTRAERLVRSRVTVDLAAGVVYVDGKVAEDRDLIRFDGPDEGVLTYAADAIATARQIDQGVRRNSDGLPPLDLLTPEEGAVPPSHAKGSAGDGTDRSEVEALLDAWQTARRERSTAFLNRAIKHQSIGFDPKALALTEARREHRAELANLLNLAPRYVNATSGDSMTYSTTVADRADLVDLSLVGYVTAIEQRLSLDDVTPRGTVVRFDLGRFLAGDRATAIDTAAKAVAMEAMTPAEVRTDVLGRAPLGARDATGAPAQPTPAE